MKFTVNWLDESLIISSKIVKEDLGEFTSKLRIHRKLDKNEVLKEYAVHTGDNDVVEGYFIKPNCSDLFDIENNVVGTIAL